MAVLLAGTGRWSKNRSLEEMDLSAGVAGESLSDRSAGLRLTYEAHRPQACEKDVGRFAHGIGVPWRHQTFRCPVR